MSKDGHGVIMGNIMESTICNIVIHDQCSTMMNAALIRSVPPLMPDQEEPRVRYDHNVISKNIVSFVLLCGRRDRRLDA